MKKRFCVLFLAVIMVFTFLPISAFAEVTVDGESKGTGTVSVESAQYVKADAAGDDLTVTGDVTGDSQGIVNSVIAQAGAEITVGGEVTAELAWPGSAIQTYDDSTKVTVEGNVTENGVGNAINAAFFATVEAGSVDEKNAGDAINAQSGAKVEIDKDVTESGNGHAIYAKGWSVSVTVNGNVIEFDGGNAIYAQEGAVVNVFGGVVENGAGSAINANNSTVIVGGNIIEKRDASGTSVAVMASNGAKVIVEGKVTADGDIVADNSALYLGQLDGEIGYEHPYVHYLIGIAPEGSVALSEVTIVSAVVADNTIDGINEKGYRYTTTAKKTDLSGQTIILKPADGKKLTVKGFDGADVTCVKNADGTVTFTLGSEFKGGLQNLVLKLEETPVYYVTVSPAKANVAVGRQATFTVQASGEGLSYQWFINRNDGSGWKALDGETGTTYTTSRTTLENDGYLYCCEVTDQLGSTVRSNEAVLHVTDEPVPQTGDSSGPVLWLMMSMLCVLAILLIRKREANG